MKFLIPSLTVLALMMFGDFSTATSAETSAETSTTMRNAHIESEVRAIIDLTVNNAKGANNAEIDSKINSLNLKDQLILLEPLRLKLSTMQNQLAQTDAELSKTNERVLENLRAAQATGKVIAVEAAGIAALEETTLVLSLIRRAKVELALENLDPQTSHLRPELRAKLKAATVVRDGRLVPSFTKVLKLNLDEILHAGVVEHTAAAGIRLATITAVAATAFALSAKAGAALLPETISDRDLLNGRNSLKASIEHLRDVVDSLSIHLELIETTYKTKSK